MMEEFPISIGNKRRGRASSIAVNILLVVLVIIILLELTFFSRFKRFYVVGDSMYPTLTGADYYYNSSGERVINSGGDYVYADTAAQPNRFDIVVITTDNGRGGETTIIKRAIAFGGETVELKSGVLYIDGQLIDEPYAVYNDPDNEYNTYGPAAVPEGCVFVLGDNRNVSIDSRDHYGMIDIDDVVGIVEEWSLNMRWLVTPFSSFFDFTLPGIFSGCGS